MSITSAAMEIAKSSEGVISTACFSIVHKFMENALVVCGETDFLSGPKEDFTRVKC